MTPGGYLIVNLGGNDIADETIRRARPEAYTAVIENLKKRKPVLLTGLTYNGTKVTDIWMCVDKYPGQERVQGQAYLVLPTGQDADLTLEIYEDGRLYLDAYIPNS